MPETQVENLGLHVSHLGVREPGVELVEGTGNYQRIRHIRFIGLDTHKQHHHC